MNQSIIDYFFNLLIHYKKDQLKVNQPYRIFNTWLGDPIRILYLEAIQETIKKENLIQLNQQVGKWKINK